MIGNSDMVNALRSARLLASLGLFFEVVVGALGYGDTVKICAALSGVALAAGLKATHIFA
jgi:hypothetical protein